MATDFVGALLGKRNPWEKSRLSLLRRSLAHFLSERRLLLGDWFGKHHVLIGWALAALFICLTIALSFSATLRLLSASDERHPPQSVQTRPSSSQTAEEIALFQEISESFARKDYRSAGKKVDLLEKLRPEEARVFQLKGVILTAEGDYAAARAAFQRAIELDAAEKIHRYNLAELEFMAGDFTQADRLFQTAQKMDPGNTRIVLRRYLCALAQGNARRAAEITQSLPSMAQSPEWYGLMVVKARRDGNDRQSRSFLTTARILYSPDQMEDCEKTLRRTGYLP